MLADSPSRLKNFIWPHEDDPKERLLLDPIPQEEMNQIMLKPMLKDPAPATGSWSPSWRASWPSACSATGST